jgi:hypothetical protein
VSKFLEDQAKRLYGLGELESEALEVLRLVVRQTERGENLDAELRSWSGRCACRWPTTASHIVYVCG